MGLEQELDRAGEFLKQFGAAAFPRMVRVRQNLQGPTVDDVAGEITRQMASEDIRSQIRPGMSVAIGVGSRGVANIDQAVKTVVATLKSWGAHPFIVPAMGSHGGATAAGQKDCLAELGITEEAVGAPVRASMDVVEVGRLPNGLPAYFDKHASAADVVVPIHRVKPHTVFHGSVESGLQKMLAIGFGKQKGATTWHRTPPPLFSGFLAEVGKYLLERVNVAFGVALVENALEETAVVDVIPGPRIPEREPQLLEISRNLMAKILVEKVDVLVIDEIGKDISGSGADPNVTGRYGVPGLTGGVNPSKMVALDLSEKTRGNGVGMGLMDVVTRRLIDKVDLAETWVNSVTSRIFTGGKMPIVMPTDQDAIGLALNTSHTAAGAPPRLVHIRSTMVLHEIWVSEAIWTDHEGAGELTALDGLKPMTFDPEGTLQSEPDKT